MTFHTVKLLAKVAVKEIKDAVRLFPEFHRLESSWSWYFRDSRGPAVGQTFTLEDFEAYTGIEDGTAYDRLVLSEYLGATRWLGFCKWVRVR